MEQCVVRGAGRIAYVCALCMWVCVYALCTRSICSGACEMLREANDLYINGNNEPLPVCWIFVLLFDSNARVSSSSRSLSPLLRLVVPTERRTATAIGIFTHLFSLLDRLFPILDRHQSIFFILLILLQCLLCICIRVTFVARLCRAKLIASIWNIFV